MDGLFELAHMEHHLNEVKSTKMERQRELELVDLDVKD